MGALTEQEIFSQMGQAFDLAAEACERLAVEQRKGPNYMALREQLKLIDGCCRQANAWREDTRWLTFANLAFEAHQKAGGWLRGIRVDPNMPRVKLAGTHCYKVFMLLAKNLRMMQMGAENLRTKKTGRRGMILPDELADRQASAHRRQHTVSNLPSDMTRRASGLIVPKNAA